MKQIGKIIEGIKNPQRPKNLYKEFQVFGVYLAESLEDTRHYSLYIKLAKQYPRAILEEAFSYTKGYFSAKSKAKIFMWKLKQLRSNV